MSGHAWLADNSISISAMGAVRWYRLPWLGEGPVNNHFMVRDFHYRDLDGMIGLHQVSFADELRATGMTPEAIARQVRSMARWRMVPFRVLMALMRREWAVFVAEADGRIVGGSIHGSTHSGNRHSCQISNFMVRPEYRRRGIGTALLEAHLVRLKQNGVIWATASVLNTNSASLGAFQKMGFVDCGRYVQVELPLPLPASWAGQGEITSRLVHADDRSALEALERDVLSAAQLSVEGSNVDQLYSTSTQVLFRKLTQSQVWQRVFEREGRLVGFIAATTRSKSSKGNVSLLVAREPEVRNAMLYEAAAWLQSQERQAIRVDIADKPDSSLLAVRDPKTDLWEFLLLGKVTSQ